MSMYAFDALGAGGTMIQRHMHQQEESLSIESLTLTTAHIRILWASLARGWEYRLTPERHDTNGVNVTLKWTSPPAERQKTSRSTRQTDPRGTCCDQGRSVTVYK